LTYDKDFLRDPEVFLPAKQRLKFGIRFPYSYEKRMPANATSEQRKIYRKELADYVRTHASNLNGFVLFDETNRYQIDFAKGW
jgi:hypothetical protein